MVSDSLRTFIVVQRVMVLHIKTLQKGIYREALNGAGYVSVIGTKFLSLPGPRLAKFIAFLLTGEIYAVGIIRKTGPHKNGPYQLNGLGISLQLVVPQPSLLSTHIRSRLASGGSRKSNTKKLGFPKCVH